LSRTRVKRTQKMLSIEETGIVTILDGKSARADARLKEGLPIISCECGAEILVLPDLKAMNKAIKTHVIEHRKNEMCIEKNLSTPGKIGELLSQLTLIKMSQKNKSIV
jgi:hypothetical protein